MWRLEGVPRHGEEAQRRKERRERGFRFSYRYENYFF